MLDFSKEEILTRKEYLNKKNKNYKKFKIAKYVLFTLVVVLLCIYIVKELKRYNTITLLANRVVEETMLSRTYRIYYMGQPYVKDVKDTSMYLYTGFDESRKKIEGCDNMKNIFVTESEIFGIIDGKLISTDKITMEQKEVFLDVVAYAYEGNEIYVYSNKKNEHGIYKGKIDEEGKYIFNKIIEGDVSQLLVDEQYIYVVANATTSKSIIRYSKDGTNRQVLSNMEQASYIICDEKNIYFSSVSDEGVIYMIPKAGGKARKIEGGTTEYSKKQEVWYNGNRYLSVYNNFVIYINKKAQDKIYIYNLENGENKVLIDNPAEIIQTKDDIIYFKLKGKIEIYRYSLTKNETTKVTSMRTEEFFVI